MKEEYKNEIVSHFESGMKEVIIKIINDMLGVKVHDLKIVPDYTPWSGHLIRIEEIGSATAEQLTDTPLLRQMFDKANLWTQATMTDDYPDIVIFRVNISYHHTRGGSNGLDLLDFALSIPDYDIKKMEK